MTLHCNRSRLNFLLLRNIFFLFLVPTFGNACCRRCWRRRTTTRTGSSSGRSSAGCSPASRRGEPPPNHHNYVNRRTSLGFFMYVLNQHCFVCRPSDSIVSEDVGIEPRTLATSVLAVRDALATRLHHHHNYHIYTVP
jgi:hypothetical protein